MATEIQALTLEFWEWQRPYLPPESAIFGNATQHLCSHWSEFSQHDQDGHERAEKCAVFDLIYRNFDTIEVLFSFEEEK